MSVKSLKYQILALVILCVSTTVAIAITSSSRQSSFAPTLDRNAIFSEETLAKMNQEQQSYDEATDIDSDRFVFRSLKEIAPPTYKPASLSKNLTAIANHLNQIVLRSEDLTRELAGRLKNTPHAIRIRQLAADANIFRKLNLYQEMENKTLPEKSLFTDNPYYCDEVDVLNLVDPANVFEDYNILTFTTNKAVPSLLEMLTHGEVDAYHNKIWNHTKPIDAVAAENYSDWSLHILGFDDYEAFELSPRDTMVFTWFYDFDYLKTMRVFHPCITQTYSIVPGVEVLEKKDKFVEFYDAYQARNYPKECIDYDKFFPRSYFLQNQQQCNQFFEIINTEEYYRAKAEIPVQFLTKVGQGVHQGKGVNVLTDDEESRIRTLYDNGKLCGQVTDDIIAQKYIGNPLLIYDRNKFDFRVYVFVTSTNPLIVFMHDAFLRVSPFIYDPKSKERNMHLTNTHVSNAIIANVTDEAERNKLLEQQVSTFKMFADDLESKGVLNGEAEKAAFLERLRQKFRTSIAHILRMGYDHLYKGSGLFRFMGFDFMLDTDFNLWFIESNTVPQISKKVEHRKNFVNVMLRDMLEIQFAYFRSRMMRVREFVVQATDEYAQKGEGWDREGLRMKFFQMNRDKLEPEFPISPTNTWTKIIDATHGMNNHESFLGNLHPACFI